jgi:acyl carrier protein
METIHHAARCWRKLLTERLIPCGTSALNGATSGERSITTADVPRADLVRIMRHYKGSLHDVIFTILAGAIRRYQELFSGMKTDGTIGAYEFMAKLVHRLLPRRFHRAVWESVLSRTNAVCTVLLGPEDERYLGGARVESIYGVTAPVIGHGAGFAFVNYAGNVCVSIVSNGGVIADPQQLMNDFQAELRELLSTANADTESDEWPASITGGVSLGEQTDTSRDDFRQRWESTPASDRRELLLDHVRAQVARVLGHSDSETIPLGHKLTDLGIDSLLAVELRTRLHTSLGGPLPETLLLDHPTVESLVAFLSEQLTADAVIAGS